MLPTTTALALLATLGSAALIPRDEATHIDLGVFDPTHLSPVVIGGIHKRSNPDDPPTEQELEAFLLRLDERRLRTRAKYSWMLDDKRRRSLEQDIGVHEQRKRDLVNTIMLERRQISGNDTTGGGKDGSSAGDGTGFGGQSGGTSETELVNWGGDIMYTIPVSIGTPPQNFTTHIDTGSPTLWVYGSQCQNSVCQGHARYDERASSTSQSNGDPFSVTYGKGYVQGKAFNDTVEMGGWKGTQEFGSADYVKDMATYKLTDAIGLSGWSWQVPSKPTPFWQNLCEAGAWSNKMFGLFLARDTRKAPSLQQQQQDPSNLQGDKPLQSMQNGGRISMNGYDSSLIKGDITWVDLKDTRQPFWRVPISSLTVQKQNWEASRTDLVLDSGTSLVYLPHNQFTAFWSAIPDATRLSRQYRISSSQEDYPIFPCRNADKLDIRVGFGGKEFQIYGGDLIMDSIDGRWCVGSFQDGTGLVDDMQTYSSSAWLAGDAIMKNFYTIHRYDPPSVGIAQLADGTTSTNVDDPAFTGGSSNSGGTGGSTGSGKSAAKGTKASIGLVVAAAALAALS